MKVKYIVVLLKITHREICRIVLVSQSLPGSRFGFNVYQSDLKQVVLPLCASVSLSISEDIVMTPTS